MLLETLVSLFVAAAPAKAPALAVAPAALLWRTPAPSYAPEKRAVDNWRAESAAWLEMTPAAAAKRALELEERDPARCVKLNNYWCVKRAGWNGEIAADAEGHVAFASAEEGAAVAALLLRRYYVDYKRRTARAIVERWAPPQCMPMVARAVPGVPASREGMARMMPQRVVPMGLAPHGLQNTLRARWLAAHGRGGVGPAPMRGARTAPLDMIATPSIMAGVDEPRQKRSKEPRAPKEEALDTVASLGALPSRAPALPPLTPMLSCTGELDRIANYAAHLAEGIAAGPNDDLFLFDTSGRPTGNLAKALANMAAVEIGPARPRMALVTAAVAQLSRLLQDPAAAASAAPPDEAPPAAPAAATEAAHQPQ